MMARRRGTKRPAQVRIRTGREAAFVAVNRSGTDHVFVSTALDAIFRSCELSYVERAVATDLAAGTVRRRLTLDTFINHFVRRGGDSLEPELRTLLRLGTYLLLFTETPAHAAVDETVSIARRFGRVRWTGFANGVLRCVARVLTGNIGSAPAASAVPTGAGRFVCLNQEVFPDPSADFPAWFSQACSFPVWLTHRWCSRFDARELLEMAACFNSVAAPTLRVNALTSRRAAVIESLRTAKIDAVECDNPAGVRLLRHAPIATLPGFDKGWFSVQDESAMHAAQLLDPQAGEVVLDLCAAPGTKSTHLAERMRNQGRIVACDVDAERLKLVSQNASRLGIDIIEAHPVSHDGTGMPPGPFDAALLDVPCSNTGVLGKRPEARWRLQSNDVDDLAALQTRLLNQAIDVIRPGGRVVYSTCSIEPQENHQVVERVCREHDNVAIVDIRSHRPGHPGDGAWQALLRRSRRR